MHIFICNILTFPKYKILILLKFWQCQKYLIFLANILHVGSISIEVQIINSNMEPRTTRPSSSETKFLNVLENLKSLKSLTTLTTTWVARINRSTFPSSIHEVLQHIWLYEQLDLPECFADVMFQHFRQIVSFVKIWI